MEAAQRTYYVVLVLTSHGWIPADGLNVEKHRLLELAGKACARYQSKYPASKYKVVSTR